MSLLEQVRHELQAPVWINADILPGPGGKATPLEPQAFLDAVGAGAYNAVLSLGWTTGWSPNTDNTGELVHAKLIRSGVIHMLKSQTIRGLNVSWSHTCFHRQLMFHLFRFRFTIYNHVRGRKATHAMYYVVN